MIKRGLHIAFATLLLLTATVTGALAQKRVALIIGNSAYTAVSALPNPVNDAKAIADAFKRMGFDEVTLKLDTSQTSLRRALGQFSRTAAGADVAVIYYAGHGIEVAGQNYLIPVDATLANAEDVTFEAVSLNTAMGALVRAGKLKLVILDACRNNPFRAKMAAGGSKRSIGRGLARVSPSGSDTLVAYAAREGTTADDGKGTHSPYTKALLSFIETPGLDIRLLFGKVRDSVRNATGNRQEPFTYGSLGGDGVFLNPQTRKPAPVTAGKKPGNPFNADALFWASIKDSTNPAVFTAYLKRFPNGVFTDLANIRLNQLKAKVASTAPPAIPVTPPVSAVTPPVASVAPPVAPVIPPVPRKSGPKKSGPKKVTSLPTPVETGTISSKDTVSGGVLGKNPARTNVVTRRVPVTRCDRLAASRIDGGRVANGPLTVRGINPARAIPACRKALARFPGTARLQFQLGLALYRNRNFTGAARSYAKAADQGYGAAISALGFLYYSGRGVNRDRARAIRLFRRAASMNDGHGLFALGFSYELGTGVRKNTAEAARLYKLAVARKVPAAMVNLASLYQNGDGVARDLAKAKHLLSRAARLGVHR